MPAKPAVFTFVPLVHKLPVESILAKDERSETLKGKSDKSIAVSQERTTGEAMSQEDICKAEIVFIKDVYEEGVRKLIQLEQEPQYSPPDHESFCGSKSPSVSACSENTPKHEATATVSMETVVDKCRGSSWQQCYDISGHSEHSLGYMANTVSVSEDRTSPINSPDLFPTPSSSRESILSEGLDKERSWYSMQPSSVASPTSFSRTVSQCSSIRSGVFSPSVVQIRRHVLAPGSSLIHTPQSCFSSCDSLSSSTCQQSPPSRRRPPLTRLSLLTAILRKGRLPVLSSGLQRPYTPCWPVNPVTLSVCNACSAASSVASVPLEISSRFSMPTSVDSRNRANWEPSRFHPSPLAAESSKPLMEGPQIQVTSSQLRRELVISPPLNKSNTIPETFPPLLPSLKSISMVRHEKPAMRACTNSFISKLQKLSPTMLLTDHTNNSKKVIPSTSKSIKERENSVPLKWTCPPNSSLSRLQRLSQQLRSQPGFPSPLRPAPEQNTPLETGSSLLDLQETTKSGGDKSEGSRPVSTLQTFQKGHNLSPSCYKTVAFPGWSSPTNSATPTPSPAPPSKDFTSSPSWSQCSTPSPRPGSGISDCSGREDKKRKQQAHKIKSSYKSLAAIPTNTILLDQQAIDEEVEEKFNYSNTQDRSDIDTHEEMCSPAELRQKSEELYAVIDEILANTGPPMENIRLEAARTDLFTDSKGKLVEDKTTAESRSLFPVCELHIKEPDEQLSPNGKEVGTSFGTTGRNMEVFEACL
ncbi:muscular LMNA-interacting protein isoform X7 [Cyprinodon tularosa]|uniref:muscular LMNA-interacting protein isoform X7 n=1 Tax=Cyprinodon tularosa TaxID=77115 RepID=UPI0018E21876|nr:muscular LMNA-interacting protein isoform X7 [Cyprinodon tularosa]